MCPLHGKGVDVHDEVYGGGKGYNSLPLVIHSRIVLLLGRVPVVSSSCVYMMLVVYENAQASFSSAISGHSLAFSF
jgi:hypothetical protein